MPAVSLWRAPACTELLSTKRTSQASSEPSCQFLTNAGAIKSANQKAAHACKWAALSGAALFALEKDLHATDPS